MKTFRWMACFVVCAACGIGLHSFMEWVFEQGRMSLASANRWGDMSAVLVSVGVVGFCAAPAFVRHYRCRGREKRP